MSMDVHEFKIRFMRGLIRPEYFYIPFFGRKGEDEGFSVYIDKLDTGGNYVSRAVISIVAYDSLCLASDAKVKNADIIDRAVNGGASQIIIRTKNSRVEISGLEPSRYYVTETQAPVIYTFDHFGQPNEFTLKADGTCVYTRYEAYVIPDNLFPIYNKLRDGIIFVLSFIPCSYSQQYYAYEESYGYDESRECIFDWDDDAVDESGEYIYPDLDGNPANGIICYYKYSDPLADQVTWIASSDDGVMRNGSFDAMETSWSDTVTSELVVKIYDGGQYKGYFTLHESGSYISSDIMTGHKNDDGSVSFDRNQTSSLYERPYWSGAYRHTNAQHGTKAVVFDSYFRFPKSMDPSEYGGFGKHLAYPASGYGAAVRKRDVWVDVSADTPDGEHIVGAVGASEQSSAASITYAQRVSNNIEYRMTIERRTAAPESAFGINSVTGEYTGFPGLDKTVSEYAERSIQLIDSGGTPMSEAYPDGPGSGESPFMVYGDGMSKSLCTDYLNTFKNGYVIIAYE